MDNCGAVDTAVTRAREREPHGHGPRTLTLQRDRDRDRDRGPGTAGVGLWPWAETSGRTLGYDRSATDEGSSSTARTTE